MWGEAESLVLLFGCSGFSAKLLKIANMEGYGIDKSILHHIAWNRWGEYGIMDFSVVGAYNSTGTP